MNGWEMLPDALCRQMGYVQVNAIASQPLHLVVYRPSDDIPRCQLTTVIKLWHESRAVWQDQLGAFSPECLAD